MCMWTPPLYAYHSRKALKGTNQDMQIVRMIGLSEHVVGCVIEFIHTSRNGCLVSRIDDLWAYNIGQGEADDH